MTGPRLRRRRLRPTVDRLDDRCLLSALSPAQVIEAYGLGATKFNVNGQTIEGDGSGETIAIVDAFHDPYLSSDLHMFDQTYGLSDPALAQINLAGGRVDSGWAQEESLDVEWAHAIAPGATIVVVEARSESTKDLLTAVDTARSVPGVVAISMSWGGAESSNQTVSDNHFTTPAGHTGITFISASGDQGPLGGAEWPSSSTRVLAVGGTTLLVGSSGNYLGESAWFGSSGGLSRFESEPGFQRSVQASGRRSDPDVAFDADPDTGVVIYSTDPLSGFGSWLQIGGTSIGAPAWAAIVAIADQGRAAAGKGSLDGATQTLPTLYSLPPTDFHKVGSLTTTGLGTPNGPSLVDDLVSSTITTVNSANSISARSRHAAVAKRVKADTPAVSGHSTAAHHAVDAALHELVHESLRGS